MATADEIKIRIIAKDEASKVFRSTKGAADGLKASLNSLKIGIAAVGVASGAFLKSVIDTGSQVQNLRIRMKFLTGSAQQGAAAFKAMNRYASQVPFALEDIQQGVPSLLTVAKTQEDLNNLLIMTGDLAAASGLTYAETSMQIQRAFAGGIASAELFRERGISAMLGFEAGVSYTAEETKKIIESAFADGTTTVAGAAQAMSKTFTGQVSMMQDAWFQLKMQLAETGVIDEATKAIRQLTEIFKDQAFIEGAKSFTTAMLELFRFVVSNWKILAAVGAVWFGATVGKGKGAAAAGAIAGITLLLDQMGILRKDADAAANSIKKIGEEVQDAGEKGGLVFVMTGGKEKSEWQSFMDGLKAGIEDYRKSIKTLETEAQAAATRGMKSLEDALVDFATGAKSAKEAFKDMARSIIADLMRIQIRKSITAPLSEALSAGISRGFNFGTAATYGTNVGSQQTAMLAAQDADFAGGGFTGYGARSGGVDGKGGFPAILHPNETVFDHTQGQGGGQQIVQNIHVTTGVSQTVRAEIANLMPQIIRAAQSSMADSRMRGGSFSSAMGA